MGSSHTSCLLILSLALSLAFFTTTTNAYVRLNVSAVLEKAGQYKMLVRLFQSTHVELQLINALNDTYNSMTLFAPTDSAFDRLPAGFLNGLSHEMQVKLLNFHLLPKFFVWDDFQTISNPVTTQASGPNGTPYGLNFTYIANQQVNVSSGLVVTTFTNALNLTKPIAIYQLNKVLLPADKFASKLAEPPATGNGSTTAASAESKGSGTQGSGANSVGLEWGLKVWSLLLLMGLGLIM